MPRKSALGVFPHCHKISACVQLLLPFLADLVRLRIVLTSWKSWVARVLDVGSGDADNVEGLTSLSRSFFKRVKDNVLC